MTTKPSDLIAIANPELAEKLAKKDEPEKKPTQETDETSAQPAYRSFKQEIWKAVFTLNIFRYAFALIILLLSLGHELIPGFTPFKNFLHPTLFLYCAAFLLLSASLFTLFTKLRLLPLEVILIAQFTIDIILTGLIVHATGSISSSFALLFLIIVTTGSVVLERRFALGLAAGAIIIIFFEHFYSVLKLEEPTGWRFDSLAMYGVLLMFAGIGISSLAKMIKHAELKSYVLGNESIEEYLVREEIAALKSALVATAGNKTEAAKLLGMTFRSFRYKLSKHEIA